VANGNVDATRNAMRRVVDAKIAFWNAVADLETVIDAEVVEYEWCECLASDFGSGMAVSDASIDEVIADAPKWSRQVQLDRTSLNSH
jgi:hypothetical protein